ncbi:MAG TPA: hypothetical protein VEH10_01880 [Thermoplasmata archaeon]|nr:hypothetical protein [Thermoplasmata archaeon]
MVRASVRVRALLSGVAEGPSSEALRHPYSKWKGAHWVLAALADLGYPPGDPVLEPVRDRVLDLWLGGYYRRAIVAKSGSRATSPAGIPVIRGRARSHASQQGNALRYLTVLGLVDERVAELVQLLLRWQWPDGGWNCDRRPGAETSSFMETLLPMRGLATYAQAAGDRPAAASACRATELFLQRHLFRRKSNGRPIRPDFLELHYPLYWHYDILGGLRGVGDVGRLEDPRASEALDWLEARELPDGGWAADARYYRVGRTARTGAESVDWGRGDSRRRNDWVTTEALWVLRAAERLSI